jgi:hypothetical protein
MKSPCLPASRKIRALLVNDASPDRLVRWQGLSGLTLRFCIAATAATALAWLSRKYCEERFLRRSVLVSMTTADAPDRDVC